MKKAVTVASMICAVCFTFATTVAYSGEALEALLACADERDDAKRLACYDAQLAALENTGSDTGDFAAPPEPVTADAASASLTGTDTTESAAIDEFGRTGKLARENAPPVPDSITATITHIEEKSRGKRIIHLSNDQVWEENERVDNLRLDEGDRITVEKGLFGSYKLRTAGNNRFTRVTRIQ